MHALLQDIRLALRRLARTPGFALVAIATLAIGLGANTAIFSLVNAIGLRPLPFAEPSRLVDVYEHNPEEVCAGCGVGTSYANYLDWRAQAKSFRGVAAYQERSVALGLPDGSEQRRAAHVSAGVFAVLGVSPLRGRVFAPEEDQPGAAHVAVLSEALWRTRFSGDSNIVGTVIRVEGEQYQVIGVMPNFFAFPAFAELWLPLSPSAAGARNDRDLGVVARLADGANLRSAEAEMNAIAKRLETEYPGEQKGWTAHVRSLHDDLARDYISGFTLMLGGVACALLIACANLANLMLARATSRRAELAVRAALGGARAALARPFLVEATIIAIVGGALGLLIADWGMHVLPSIKALAGEGLPGWIRYELDWRVYVFALGASLLTGLGFGAFAARYAARGDLSSVMNEGGRGSSGGRSRTRNTLVVVQVAAALVLVIVGGLLNKAMLRGQAVDMGYDMSNLMRADIGISGRRYDDPRAIAEFANRLSGELQHSAGVSAVGMMALYVANWPGTPHEDIVPDGHTADEGAAAVHHINNVSPDYFTALGAPLVAGRTFAVSDAPGSMPVAILNSTLAKSLWPRESAIGKHIRLGAVSWTIVGIAPDFNSAFATGVRPLMYVPVAQHPQMQPGGQPLTLYVRTGAGAADIARTIRTTAQRVDPDVTANTIMSEAAFMDRLRSPYQAMAALAGALGLFACLLAAIGIYGVIAYFVGQRTHEIGVRIALGASPLNVMRLVLRYGLVLSGTGIVIGGLVAVLVTRALGYMLFGVSPTDPVVFGSVAAGFVAVSLLAAYIPARRATRVDPMTALRAE
jgi:predicted permease